MIFVMMNLNFLCEKKILARLEKRTIFALMRFVMKTSWFLQFTLQIKIWKLNGFVAYN